MSHPASPVAQTPPRALSLQSVWRARWLVLGAAVAAGIGGYLVAQAQPSTYTAESRVILSAEQDFDPLGRTSFNDPSRFLSNQVSVMTTPQVLEAALEDLDGPATTSAELAESVRVSALADSDVITVAASAGDPELAAARANAVVTAYAEYVTQRVEAAAEAAIETTIDPALANQIRTEAAVYGDGVALVEPAVPPATPASPRPLQTAALLAALAAVAASALALVRTSRRPPSDASPFIRAAGQPVLGTVSIRRDRTGRSIPVEAPGFEMALVALDYAMPGRDGPVLVTGTSPHSDSAATVRGLASAAAHRGRKVLVVDAEPGAHTLLQCYGFTEPGRPLSGPPAAGSVDGLSWHPSPDAGVDIARLDDSRGTRREDDTALDRLAQVTPGHDLVLVHSGAITEDPVAYSLLRQAVAAVAIIGLDEDPDLLLGIRRRLDTAERPLAGVVITRQVRGRRADHAVGTLSRATGAALPRAAPPAGAAPRP